MDLINILFAKALSNGDTEEYVDEAIKALKGEVNADLDTLEELSKALGNDPDFFLSVKNELDKKVTQEELDATKAEINQFKNEIVTDKDSATDNTKFAIGVAEQNLEVPSIEEFNQLKDDVAAITPDDSTVDGKPWTSKKTVDSLCQPFEESGNPVQVYPVENYPLGVKVSLEPVQGGIGDPSPDNIRPISGWTAANVVRTGKNLFDQNDTTYLTKDNSLYGVSDARALAQINTLPAGTYTLSFAEKIVSLNGVEPIETRFGLYLRATSDGQTFNVDAHTKISNPTVGQIITKSVTFTLTDKYVGKFQYFYIYTGKNGYFPAPNIYTANIYDVQIGLGSTATPYESYTGDTYTAELPETIYGGELDWNTGVLTITHAKTKFKPTHDINTVSSWTNCVSIYDNFDSLTPKGKNESKYLTDKLPVIYWDSKEKTTPTAWYANTSFGVIFPYETLGINSTSTKAEIQAAAKAYFDELNATMVYELATPYTIQLTPQQITALSGVNTLYTDAGTLTVTGREDPRHTIVELKNAIISLGGNI